jgi:hypothetical protein
LLLLLLLLLALALVLALASVEASISCTATTSSAVRYASGSLGNVWASSCKGPHCFCEREKR